MAGQSRLSTSGSGRTSKKTHVYSSNETNAELARRRYSMYRDQPTSHDPGFLHRVSYRNVDVDTSVAEHKARIEAEMAKIMGQKRR
ncbi:hypothetical protein CPLU01_08463 [Colletotrichum plurivorum]|uniref:Uncharacterized protein n=1 Tax=Colletotrichum plurivorum TaxID=2175906 RepID=A0A8H6NDE7_9PEZI|nr:hypothetical protein CPLU01_08463 [Colletotrichum plurivorum]